MGFNPAPAFTYFWTVQSILILIGWSSYMYFQYWGLLFILFGVLCFDIEYLLKPTKRLEIIQKPKYEIVYKRTSKHVYFIVMTIAVLGVAYEIYSKGFSIQNFLDLNAFIEMSAQNSLERYSGESESGLLTRLFGINAYTCPLLGGLLYYSFDKRKYLSPPYNYTNNNKWSFPRCKDGYDIRSIPMDNRFCCILETTVNTPENEFENGNDDSFRNSGIYVIHDCNDDVPLWFF